MKDALPGKVLAWYGDDFTGSTDVLEMLSLHGLPAVLFLDEPDAETAARFAGYRAFGLAGSSRSRSPEWMEENLPAVFHWMAGLGAPVRHYKVCSTFDSSSGTGSIGKAMDIGRRVLRGGWTPILVGAPALRRYTAFGHLFAAAGDAVHRIDRHPAMSGHPVTPMHEADLRLHLAKQTAAQIGLLSFAELKSAEAHARIESFARSRVDAVLIDVLDAETLREAGRLLWAEAERRPLFIVGSSGVEHALAAWWKAGGLYEAPMHEPDIEAADRVLALSGSCAPQTAEQIAFAAANGFAMVRLDPLALAGGDGREQAAESAIRAAVSALKQGRSVVLYSAAGPGSQLPRETADRAGFREDLARASGRVLATVLDQTGVRRIVVAGGDTSSHAGAMLGIQALTFLDSLAPGAPLCRTWSRRPARDGLEIVFKGGQCGNADFFLKALRTKD